VNPRDKDVVMTGTDSASATDKSSKRPEWIKNLIIPVLVTVIGGLLVAITIPAGSTVREVFFPTRVTVTGIVESGGAPVRSASIRVDDDGPNATTDETGRFQLADVDNGKHDLHVDAAGIRSHTHKFSLASGAPATDLGIIKVEPYLRLGYYASMKPPTRPSGDPKVKYDVTLWLIGGDDAMRTVQEVAYTRPAPLPRDQVRGADLARSFCYRVRGSVRFSDLMVLGGAFAAAQGTVRLTDGRSFGVAAVPGAEQPPDCKAAKGPDADELPEPVPGTPLIPNPNPNPNPGPVKVAIPNVAGMTEAAAEQELKDAGFEPQIQRQQNATTPEGQAIGTVPQAGTKKAKGTQVVLLVSTGPSTGCDPRTMPDVMGRTEEVAKARLECSGFTVEVIASNGDGAEGTVVGQNPLGGTSVEPGAKVSIKVVVQG
jgi:PASTA domain/Carboxypeptidase regulatory-like domain